MDEVKKPRKSREFKKKILKEISETKNIALVARMHGLNYQTVAGWVKSERRSAIQSQNSAQKRTDVHLQKLELENKILRELLKKTNQAWLSEDPSLSHLSRTAI